MAFGADISETLGNVGNRATAHGYNQPDEIRKQYTGCEHGTGTFKLIDK